MSKHTLPPSFPMEKQKKLLQGYHDSLRAKEGVQAISSKVFLQEGLTDTMSIARCGEKAIHVLWRPNNYRLKISSICNLNQYKVVVSSFPMEFSKKGIRSVVINKSVTLMFHKDCVVAIFSLRNDSDKKLWYDVEVSSVDDFNEWVDEKVSAISSELVSEVRKFGLPLDYDSAVWIRHEDGVKNEEFLDSLPKDMILHDTYFKKVYDDEAEFKSPAYVKNFISNRAIESVVPEIAELLSRIERAHLLDFLKANIKNLSEITGKFRDDILRLDVKEKADFSDWLFEAFHEGIVV